MIEANELRIGNYLKWDDRIEIVEAILQDNFIQCQVLHADRFASDYEGVPLTEEWLLKFGFVYKPENKLFELFTDGFASTFPIWIYNREWFIAPMGDNKGHIYIEYVHQLQNLYFALTSTELTIKELVK